MGFDISERTVLRWMRKAPRNPERAKRWATFLTNHREAIAAMDFFTVPTLTFGVLYGFFIIAHDRRRILHFKVTRHPTGAWVVQQLREAFPYDSAPKYLNFDRSSNFNEEVVSTIRSFGIQPKRTSFRSPWQNGVAECWVGACRQKLLNHVIVLNERHLRGLLKEYVRYYHDDRTILDWENSLPLVVTWQNVRMLAEGSFQHLGLADCIIATTSLPKAPYDPHSILLKAPRGSASADSSQRAC